MKKSFFSFICLLSLFLFVQCESDMSSGIGLNPTRMPAYTVMVDGRKITVDTCRVSAMPVNMYWMGIQRPLDQTEPAYFAGWDMPENGTPVKVTIVSDRNIQSVKVNPDSYNINQIEQHGDTISFYIKKAGSVTVEINGIHNALHLFANPPEKNIPTSETAGIRYYYAPGNHYPGAVQLQSGESVYIARGAVVYGRFWGYGASNIHIYGGGIIDGSLLEQGVKGHILGFTSCVDVTIDGITLRDPASWCCAFFGCNRLNISNTKLIGLWRYNADGIDVCNCQNVNVQNCFIRSFDDALVVKGIAATPGQPSVLNNEFSGCVLWCDWGNAIVIGGETYASEISNVVFKDCDIIRTTHHAMQIINGDHATIKNIRFKDIRVSIDNEQLLPVIQNVYGEKYELTNTTAVPNLMGLWIGKTPYSTNQSQFGTMSCIVFEDISVKSNRVSMPVSRFIGANEEHQITNVTIRNLQFNGKYLQNADQAGIEVGSFVSNVRFP